jgi:hypothetical protein
VFTEVCFRYFLSINEPSSPSSTFLWIWFMKFSRISLLLTLEWMMLYASFPDSWFF